jgi:SAM-dependent methyltransferase
MDTNSERYYDSAAAHYSAISLARSAYIQGVDLIVIEILLSTHAKTLLDIGAGDGRRSKYLANTLGIKEVMAVESSLKMAIEAREQLGEENVLVGDASKLELPEDHFDAVVSLWNVFGHIPDKNARIEVLKKISKSLKLNGKCIIDVNNRYNIRHYGWLAVGRNIFNELMQKKDNGWFCLNIDGVQGEVYIHRPSEFKQYLAETNLKLDSVHYIDYATGATRRTQWEGQCVYVLSRIK